MFKDHIKSTLTKNAIKVLILGIPGIILAGLSIAYSDPDEPCQKTSVDIMMTAST